MNGVSTFVACQDADVMNVVKGSMGRMVEFVLRLCKTVIGPTEDRSDQEGCQSK